MPQPEAVDGRRRRGLAALAGCAVLASGWPARAGDAAAGVGQAVEVAAGVYMVRGSGGEAEPANRGRIGNAGFVVGPRGVVAIDAGTSYRHGQALLAAITAVTAQPIRALLLTHTRQEFLFGATAYRERGVPVHMHRDAAQLMAARCERCLATLQRVLGAEEMAGTAMFKPDVVFDDSHTLDLAGRPLRVLAYGHASGPGHVALLDEDSGTLFAGGLLDQRRIPDVQDSDLAGWQRALAALRRERIARIVPGHGPLAEATLIDTVERYLLALQARMLALLEAGASLGEVPDLATLPGFEDWDQADVIHRRNASIVYLRLERERLIR